MSLMADFKPGLDDSVLHSGVCLQGKELWPCIQGWLAEAVG